MITVRDAVSADIDRIIPVYEKKEIHVSTVRTHTPEEYRQYHLNGLRERKSALGKDENLRVFLAEEEPGGAIAGYLILILKVTETITGENQAYIYDYGLSPEWPALEVLSALITRSGEAAAGGAMKYLTVEIFVQDEKNGRLFGELGFSREMSRIIKKVEPHEISPPSPDPFRVRKGDNDDAFFIMWLNSQSASFTIPPGRDIPKDEILLRYLATYTELPLDDNSYFEALIIEDRALMKPIGYLLLKLHYEDSLTGEQLAYIYDLAIHSDYWGKRATQRLMREAENRLAARGIAYWLGDISIENPRALKTAMKSLRFQLESERWLKKLPKL